MTQNGNNQTSIRAMHVTNKTGATAQSRASRILIIDDEKDILKMVKLLLERNGLLVDAFDNPIEAVAEFSQKPAGYYGLVLLDVRMPQMSGFEVYRAMRAVSPRLQICFMTAHETLEDDFQRLFPDQLLDCIIKKPTSTEKLLTIIRKRMAVT